MKVMVLRVYDEGCGDEEVYVCRTREDAERIVTACVDGKYEGERERKKLLKKCFKDMKAGLQGAVWSLYFDLYETGMKPPKVWMLKHGNSQEYKEEMFSSRESAVHRAVEHYNDLCNKNMAQILQLKHSLEESSCAMADNWWFMIAEHEVND